MSNCSSRSFLKKNEYLLTSQSIKGNKKLTSTPLEALYQQKGNRKILGGLPYLNLYMFGKKFYDKGKIRKQIDKTKAKYQAKIAKDSGNERKVERHRIRMDKKVDKLENKLSEGNWLMRTVGEPPVIFDSALAGKTAREMKAYGFNHGYFDNTTRFEIDTLRRKKIKVRYFITENEPYRLNRIRLISDDKNIARLADSTKSSSFLDSNQVYNQDDIVAERERLTKLYRNTGYYTFSRTYIFADIYSKPSDTAMIARFNRLSDSSSAARMLDLHLKIGGPSRGKLQQYRLSSIKFVTDAGESAPLNSLKKTRDTANYQGVRFSSYTDDYAARILYNKLLVLPGQIYHHDRINNSQAQLAGMDIFKFVNFNFDTLSDSRLGLRVSASRLPKYQISDELGLVVSQGAPGPFANIGFKIRNAFNGYEIFELNARYSQEGQISAFIGQDSIFRARELGVSASILFPEALLPYRWKIALNEFAPRTRLIASYTAIKRPEYRRNITRATLTYTVQPKPTVAIGVSPIDVSINFQPRNGLNPAFRDFLVRLQDQGNNLLQSFNSALVTNFNAYYMYNTYQTTQHKEARYFRFNAEWGGEIPNLLNQAFVKSSRDSLLGLKYFLYTRISSDFRYYVPISPKALLATRINTGIVWPRGRSKTDNVLPWEKYYFTGGSNSIRAWAPRRLGPGSYTGINEQGNQSYVSEQPGNILLETSVEIRQKIISFLEGAVFMDAGNVWTIQPEASRPGSDFKANRFFKEIALGTGAGVRLNFSFLIVRFDMGVQAYSPSLPEGDRWVIKNISLRRPFGLRNQRAFNIGIGYPF